MEITGPTTRRRIDTARRRTGCQTCRGRRKKCDETRPYCLACLNRGLTCAYQRPFVFKHVSQDVVASPKSPVLSHSENDGTSSSPASVTSPFPVSTYCHVLPLAQDNRGKEAEAASLPFSMFAHSISPDVRRDSEQNAWGQARESSPTSTVISRSGLESTGSVADCIQPLGLFSSSAIRQQQQSRATEPSSHCLGPLQLVNSPLPNAEQPWQQNASTPYLSLGQCSNSARQRQSLTMEDALIRNFEQKVLPLTPSAVFFPRHFYENSCFYAAALALSSAMLRSGQSGPGSSRTADGYSIDSTASTRNWVYYDSAVKELKEQLKRPSVHGLEQLAGAALLLAYHDIEVGTPLDIRNHACGLDAIASRLDFSSVMTSGLFKAWRMLRCDRKFLSLATRKTVAAVDAYDSSSLVDGQIAIREVLLGIWKLHGRYAMEATFSTARSSESINTEGLDTVDENDNGGIAHSHDDTTANNAPSPSEKAGHWLRSVLNRDCDRHQQQQHDFYTDTLTPHLLQQQCSYYARQLDRWHAELGDSDLPIVQDAADSDFMVSPTSSHAPWDSSAVQREPLTTYRLSSEAKAFDHILYLLSRMICNYLRSLLHGGKVGHVSEAWGRIILGIVCGMRLPRQRFTLFRLDMLLLMTALLGEGPTLATMVMEHVIPIAEGATELGSAENDPGFFTWGYLKLVLRLIVRERAKGKSIRVVIDDSIQDSDQRRAARRHMVVAFGDLDGKRHFREVYNIDC